MCPQITTPTHRFCDKFIVQISIDGKSWVPSPLPLGELVATPKLIIEAATLQRDNHPGLVTLPDRKEESEDGDNSNGQEGANGALDGANEDTADGEDSDGFTMLNGHESDVELASNMATHGSNTENGPSSSSSGTSSPDSDEAKDPDDEPEAPLVMTFSCGKEDDMIIETAFDICMGKVLDFLWMKRDQCIEKEDLALELAKMKVTEEKAAADAAEQDEEMNDEEIPQE